MGHPLFTYVNNSTKRGARLRITGQRAGDRFQWANRSDDRRPKAKKNIQKSQPQNND